MRRLWEGVTIFTASKDDTLIGGRLMSGYLQDRLLSLNQINAQGCKVVSYAGYLMIRVRYQYINFLMEII